MGKIGMLRMVAVGAFFAGVLSWGSAFAGEVTLRWNANNESNVAGYKVYYGTGSRAYANSIDAGNRTSYTVSGLLDNRTYYFATTAYNTSGSESEYSNEVAQTTSSTCAYSISPNSASFPSAGGSGTVSVTASSGCSWTASSGISWIAVTLGASGSGNGTVGYTVSPNTRTSARTGAVTIAGRVLTVNQAASGRTSTTSYTITASTGQGGSISPSGSISVRRGDSRTFSIRPNRWYRISNVIVDGVGVGPVSTYTFRNVTANHTIGATFRRR